jgi:hypothetical protein
VSIWCSSHQSPRNWLFSDFGARVRLWGVPIWKSLYGNQLDKCNKSIAETGQTINTRLQDLAGGGQRFGSLSSYRGYSWERSGMIYTLRNGLLGGCWLLLGIEVAWAGWVTIKNQTGQTLIIQETFVVAGQARRGKPIQLVAGETVREFLPLPTVKNVEIYDPKNPNRPLWSGKLSCKNEDQTYILSSVNGQITVQAISVHK